MIRVATVEDAAQISNIYGHSVSTSPASFELEPPDEAEMRRRISTTTEKYPWLVSDDGSGVAGYAYASQHRPRLAYRWSVDTAIYIHESHRRTGLGQRLYRSLFKLLVRQGLYKAYAGITLPNDASVGLHEGLGFKLIGINNEAGYKLGAWHDVGWWQLRLQPVQSPPREPVNFPQLLQNDLWEESL